MRLKKLLTQNEIEENFDDIKTFCKSAIRDCKNPITRRNMDYLLWHDNPASLMYKLYIKKSFMMLTLVYDNDIIIGLSGVEPYNKKVALIARRLFELKNFRGQGVFLHYMLEEQLKFIRNLGYEKGLITVNIHRKYLYDVFKRIIQGKAVRFFYFPFSKMKIEIIDEPFMLNNVMQYGIYIEV